MLLKPFDNPLNCTVVINDIFIRKEAQVGVRTQKRVVARQPEQITALGKEAYRTITEKWNAECAAQRCLEFYEGWKAGKLPEWEDGPLSAAPKLSARWSYNEGRLDGE